MFFFVGEAHCGYFIIVYYIVYAIAKPFVTYSFVVIGFASPGKKSAGAFKFTICEMRYA